MLKTLLIYAICEQCIEVAFDGFRKSFLSPRYSYNIGQRFTLLTYSTKHRPSDVHHLWHAVIYAINDDIVTVISSDFDDPAHFMGFKTNIHIDAIKVTSDEMLKI